MRSEGVRYMAEASEELIILTDSSKLSKPSLVHQLSLEAVDRMITDEQLEASTYKLLQEHGIAIDFIS